MSENISSNISATQEMLAKHHRGGEAFVQLMKQTFAGRFNDDFWALWESNIAPVLPERPKMIDLGTGPGTFLKVITERYPSAKAYGVECAQYMLDAVEEIEGDSEMIVADLRDPHLPIEDGMIDVAVASVVIHEMHQPIKCFREMARLLKPGGMFYILDWVRAPLEQYLQNNSDVDAFDSASSAEALDDVFVHFIEHNRFTVDDLIFMLGQCEFEIVVKQMINDNQMARLIARKPA